jgi:hypothetical protein
MLHGICYWRADPAGSRRLRFGVAMFAGTSGYWASISPAAAQVCDKGLGAPASFGLSFVLAAIGAIPAAAFGWMWPSYAAGVVLALLAGVWVWDFAAGEIVAVASWREGCEPASSLLLIGGAAAAIVLGRWARRFHEAGPRP